MAQGQVSKTASERIKASKQAEEKGAFLGADPRYPGDPFVGQRLVQPPEANYGRNTEVAISTLVKEFAPEILASLAGGGAVVAGYKTAKNARRVEKVAEAVGIGKRATRGSMALGSGERRAGEIGLDTARGERIVGAASRGSNDLMTADDLAHFWEGIYRKEKGAGANIHASRRRTDAPFRTFSPPEE